MARIVVRLLTSTTRMGHETLPQFLSSGGRRDMRMSGPWVLRLAGGLVSETFSTRWIYDGYPAVFLCTVRLETSFGRHGSYAVGRWMS